MGIVEEFARRSREQDAATLMEGRNGRDDGKARIVVGNSVDPALVETKLSGITLYRGRILNLRVDGVRLPSGKRTNREVVEHAPAVGILAENDQGEILLVEQYRYPVGEVLLEVPAGIMEPDELPLETARRELQEEIGFDAEHFDEMCRFYTAPGFSDEVLILFHATGLFPSALAPDFDETIRVVPVSVRELPDLLCQGRIKDGKTLVALCRFLCRKMTCQTEAGTEC
ncbi:NUDIX hydrolase [Aminiphilus circumscriptus]|uniref:NUDIX hydrolase n=1 Tax=Aminiphilus circumscriptus TaxID=290732 RepID=UPI000492634B|nr:NUDIX hydrolase [Aminiphilus circumscriptus]